MLTHQSSISAFDFDSFQQKTIHSWASTKDLFEFKQAPNLPKALNLKTVNSNQIFIRLIVQFAAKYLAISRARSEGQN